MAPARPASSDQRLERTLGRLLRAGVALAAILVAFGGALYLAHHGPERPHYRVFRGEPAELRSPTGILAEARELRGQALIELGLLALIATPVARVVFSLAAFARERDRVFVGVTLLVLVVLVYSLLAGGS